MNALESTQESTDISPHAFTSVDMDFTNAIAVIIASPFMFTVLDSGMSTNNVVVS